MTKAIVHRPRAGELAAHVPPAEHPVAVYLARLSSSSVPSMRCGLNAVAAMADASADAMTLRWQDLRHKHTAAIRARLIDAYKPRTVNRTIAAVRGVLKEAWSLELMDTNDYQRAIAALVNVNTSHLPPSGRTLTPEEIGVLYSACARRPGELAIRDAALVTMLYAAGLRREEACSLNVRDYRPKNAAVEVTGKGKKTRIAYLPDSYRQGIEPWWEHRKDAKDGFLFPRYRRGTPEVGRRLGKTGVSHIVGELVKTIRHVDPEYPSFTPHDLRRSFGTHLLDAGADILMVQRLMGHARLETTSIYDRRGEAGKQKAIDFLPTITFPGSK